MPKTEAVSKVQKTWRNSFQVEECQPAERGQHGAALLWLTNYYLFETKIANEQDITRAIIINRRWTDGPMDRGLSMASHPIEGIIIFYDYLNYARAGAAFWTSGMSGQFTKGSHFAAPASSGDELLRQ